MVAAWRIAAIAAASWSIATWVQPGISPGSPREHPAEITKVAIGARVRVVAPELGGGWRVGMFNQTRTVPACSLILLMHPGPTRRIAVTVPIEAATRLQVSALFPGDGKLDPNPAASSYDDERWTEVDVSKLKTPDRCASAITVNP